MYASLFPRDDKKNHVCLSQCTQNNVIKHSKFLLKFINKGVTAVHIFDDLEKNISNIQINMFYKI